MMESTENKNGIKNVTAKFVSADLEKPYFLDIDGLSMAALFPGQRLDRTARDENGFYKKVTDTSQPGGFFLRVKGKAGNQIRGDALALARLISAILNDPEAMNYLSHYVKNSIRAEITKAKQNGLANDDVTIETYITANPELKMFLLE